MSDKVVVKQRIYFSPGTPLTDSLNGIIPPQKISPRSPRSIDISTPFVPAPPIRRKPLGRFGVQKRETAVFLIFIVNVQ